MLRDYSGSPARRGRKGAVGYERPGIVERHRKTRGPLGRRCRASASSTGKRDAVERHGEWEPSAAPYHAGGGHKGVWRAGTYYSGATTRARNRCSAKVAL